MVPLLPLVLLGGAIILSKNARSRTNRDQQNVGTGQTVSSAKGTSGFGDMSQQDMQLLQYHLSWLGYFYGPLHGNYDEATAEAVRGFQDANGLQPVDGLPGPATLEMLDNVLSAQP